MKKNQKELKQFFSKRKVEIVLRMLRGESLDELSRELAVPASRLSEWRWSCPQLDRTLSLMIEGVYYAISSQCRWEADLSIGV